MLRGILGCVLVLRGQGRGGCERGEGRGGLKREENGKGWERDIGNYEEMELIWPLTAEHSSGSDGFGERWWLHVVVRGVEAGV